MFFKAIAKALHFNKSRCELSSQNMYVQISNIGYLHITSVLSEFHLLLLVSNVHCAKSASNRGNHGGIIYTSHPDLHTSSLALHYHTHTTKSVASGVEGFTDHREKQRNPLVLQNHFRRANTKTLIVTKLKAMCTQLPPFMLFSSSQEGQIPSYNNNNWKNGRIP